jgi:hypothetical protein
MSKQLIQDFDDEDDVENEDYELSDQDYGFIISADGELKHLFTPEEFYLDPPPVVRKILKALGIKDINTIPMDGNDTLH